MTTTPTPLHVQPANRNTGRTVPVRARVAGAHALAALLLVVAPAGHAQLDSAGSQVIVRGPGGFEFALPGENEIYPTRGFAYATATGDFNCDGIDDVALGNSSATVNGEVMAGQVVIAYGDRTGLRPDNGIGLSQSSANMPGGSEILDQFGQALAAGRLDLDDCDDLVVGTPEEDLGWAPMAGSLTVLFGHPSGISGARAFNLPRASESGDHGPQMIDWFGSAVAIVDILDSFGSLNELVIGVPLDDAGWFGPNGGSIDIRSGVGGVPLVRRLGRFFQDECCGEATESGDAFGMSLAVGDFDGDGRPDVAIGAPMQDRGSSIATGSVSILYGGIAPVGLGGWISFDQDSPGVPGDNTTDSRFGHRMAAGDFNGDGADDLAIGVPGKKDATGAVVIRYGRTDGVNGFARSVRFTNAQVGLPDADGDQFGDTVAAGDFNGDGYLDLAAGAHGVSVGGVVNAGAAVVLYGGPDGLTLAGRQLWHKNRPGVPGEALENEMFGSGVGAGDFNDDGVDDLIVGVPFQRAGVRERGGIVVLYGRAGRTP
jgi:hypothetical protein